MIATPSAPMEIVAQTSQTVPERLLIISTSSYSVDVAWGNLYRRHFAGTPIALAVITASGHRPWPLREQVTWNPGDLSYTLTLTEYAR